MIGGCAWRDSGPVRIGLAGNFQDATGAPALRAAQLALEEINRTGGVDGRPIELVVRDDRANRDTAVAVATELYQSGVVAVVGHIYSGPTLAAAAVYNGGRDPVVQLTPSATAPEVSHAGPYTFRVCPSDRAHGETLAAWTRSRLRLQRAAVIYLNDDYGRGVRQTFAANFRRQGGALAGVYPYLGTTPEVGPYLEDLTHHERAEALVIAGYREDASTILRAARAQGFRGAVLGGDGLEGIEADGAIADGVYTSAAYLPDVATEANRRFLEAYRRRFPEAPAPNFAAVGAYESVHLLREVMGRVGTGRRAIRDGLAQVGSTAPAFAGITGPLAFDSLGDVPGRRVYVGVVERGRIRLADGQ
ncbi:MAG TPA: ABC transporter substrate-binding protein [Gemmatimonadales bacterium]|nr:ABC transporter substrate-binding protein [Gemmatimonadales bacterium]